MKKFIISTAFLASTLTFSQVVKDSTKTQTIESVQLKGKKNTIERKVDRLVFNVQNSMVAQGNSGIEVLQNTPLLKVDEDKGLLSIVGKSGLSIMVNDRMLNLSGSELVNYIKNLRSEDILKIEVITTPPAKYEAQGNSGILNIVLKKNDAIGWNGNISTYLKQTTYTGSGGSAALNYQNKKLKTSLKVRGYDEEKKSVENYQIIGNSSAKSKDIRRDMNDGLGINAAVEYNLSDNATLGGIYDFSKIHSNMDIVSTANYFEGNQNTLNSVTNSEHRSPIQSQMLNLYYDQKLGDHKLSLGSNYYSTNPLSTVNFTTTDLADHSSQIVRNISNVDYHIFSTQADLVLNFKSIVFETGLKYSQFSNDSDISYFNKINSDYEIDPSKSNVFNYDEKNYAAYISASQTINEKWSAKAGFRYEFAETNGFSPTTNSNTENKYGKLFPTAYIAYKANDNHQFSLNYSKRINRPNFRALDPFRWYSNPTTYYAGNPMTQPSINHNLEFNYLLKNKFSANLYYQKTLNAFEQITTLEGINSVSTYQNYFNLNSYGINLNYNNTFFKIWETSVSTSWSFTDMEVLKYDATPQNGSSFYFSINNTLQLDKAKRFYAFANYWQSLPSKSGNTISQTNGSLNLGIRGSFMDKKLQMSLSVNDIFKQAGWRGSVYFSSNVQSFNNYWDARRLTLSANYSFGNLKKARQQKNIEFNDKQRAQ